MKIDKFGKKNQGQSLLEAIVAFGVITLILVALISAITVSLANAQYARNKAQATKYAQEAIEWLRGQRNIQTNGWSDFYEKSDPEKIYCINSFPASYSDDLSADTCGTNVITGTIFSREMKLTGNGGLNDKVTALVTVSWVQGTRAPKVELETVLTKW